MFTDLYELLEISPNANSETIERMFRHFASRHHPDNQQTGDATRFHESVEAHNILRDPVKRAAYDLQHQDQSALSQGTAEDTKRATPEAAMNVSGEATKSFWMKDTEFPSAPRLEQSERYDVAVVGAGIAGVSIAYELTMAGRKVVLVDRGPLLGGMTSRTTAHLAPICDDGLSELVKVRGEELRRGFRSGLRAVLREPGRSARWRLPAPRSARSNRSRRPVPLRAR